MNRAPFDPSFLARITFAQSVFWFEALTDLELPPFAGSALRGALGWAFQSLCPRRPPCTGDCASPHDCPFFLLFERNRSGGDNLLKPYILEPPVPVQLERIAAGAPVHSPYLQTAAGELSGCEPISIPQGGCFPVRFTLFGQAIPILPLILDLLSRAGLHIGGGQMRLDRAEDAAPGGRVLFDRQIPAWSPQPPVRQSLAHILAQPCPRRLRVVFATPIRLRAGAEDSYCFHPATLASHFWQAALTRAVRIYNTFCTHTGSGRLPFLKLPSNLPACSGTRLFRYKLPRLSHRQKQFMEFDGMIGSIFYEGDFSVVFPLVLAAEVLHIGQKATFGLGRVGVQVDNPQPVGDRP